MERNKKTGQDFVVIFKKIQTADSCHLYTRSFGTAEHCQGRCESVAGAGDLNRLPKVLVFVHFLDSLACLFFGGAHFKHNVSTEGERESEIIPSDSILHWCSDTR